MKDSYAEENRPLTIQSVAMIASLIAGACGLITYAYSNFLPKDIYSHDQDSVEKRLDRIEGKMDKLIENFNRKK